MRSRNDQNAVAVLDTVWVCGCGAVCRIGESCGRCPR